jgi:hypothetical protein
MVLEVVAGIPVLCHCHRIFLQEFLWDRNSCIYAGFLRIPPDFSRFLRIPVPAKTVWLWPATKEGSLLSKIWTKIDFFNLSSHHQHQDLTMASAAPILC